MSLKKATIYILEGPDDPGKESNKVEVMFNPNEYSLESSNRYSYQPIPGLSLPVAQFVNGESATLTMELFFDTYEKKEDVRNHTKKITGLLDVDKDLHTPPLIRFVWGSLTFKGIVERVSSRFTMFLESGTPVRATLNVTFREVQSITEQFKRIPRQSADRTKQRTVRQGESLWHIAAQEYDDPGLWREIARANGIEDPRRIEPGTVLKIPRLNG
jgi:hypothetical protein